MKLRIESPCMNCKDRFCGCHSSCVEYEIYKSHIQEINKLREHSNRVTDDYLALRRTYKRKRK